VDKTTVSAAVGGEGVATVRLPGQPAQLRYTAGNTIPANLNLRFQMATGQLDNNRRLRTVRHDIARVYTVMRERELGLSVSPDDVTTGEGAA
jgi:hypothetical protein